MKSSQTPQTGGRGSDGFSRLELLVLVVVASLLTSMLLPALARDASWNSRTFCLYRMNRLAQALALYTEESGGWLPPNYDDANTTPFHDWVGGDVSIGGRQEFDPDILSNPQTALLTPYLQGDISLYRCPLDPREGLYQGTNSNLAGQIIPATRTVSLNNAVGTNPYAANPAAPGKSACYGPWLSGSHTEKYGTWLTYGKMSDFVRPGPAATFTLIEEDGYSINDGCFSCVGPSSPQNYEMIDRPATYHDMAAAVCFADGHVEMHRWLDSRTAVVNGNVRLATQTNNPDIAWLAQHASALIVPPAN